MQTVFLKNVGLQSVIRMMEDFRNSFEEDSQNLLVLDTKEIAAPPGGVDAVRRARKVGQVQSDNFVMERLVERMKPHRRCHPQKQAQNLQSTCCKTPGTGQAAYEIPQEWRGPALVFTSGARTGMGNWESRQSSKPSVPLHYRMATVIFSLGQKT